MIRSSDNNIIQAPYVLNALNPIYAISFFNNQFSIAFITLGAVVLCVTGAESLYADMGHFGRNPIRITWFSFVFPALTLNYFGQGALILSDASNIKNPFYLTNQFLGINANIWQFCSTCPVGI